MRKISMCFSIYLTIILSFERYRAVTNPIRHRNRSIGASPKKRLLKYIFPAFLVSFVIYGIPSFFAFKMELYQLSSVNEMNASRVFEQEETTYCLNFWWRLEKIYVLWYSNVLSFIITSAIPATLLIIFNTKMYLAIQHSNKNKGDLGRRRSSTLEEKLGKEIQQALERRNEILQSSVLIGIIVAFFTCHALRVTLNFEEIIYLQELNELKIMEQKHGVKCVGVQFWNMIANDWSHFFLQINGCINFFIYGYLSEKFKRALTKNFFRCMRFQN
jgi:hypothetical protein